MGMSLSEEKAMDDYKGKTVDSKYKIYEFLGKGATGVVYLSQDIEDSKYVAIKILRSRRWGDKKYIERFQNEAKAINFLDHPNIARVERIELDTDTPYIISEFVNGPNLKEYMEYKKGLELSQALEFISQILCATEYLHSKGIIHKDIRPHNILVSGEKTVKLLDFGISDFPGNEIKSPFYRDIGAVHYLSPELCMGNDYDIRTDIYSIGIMFYEMITGELPFDSHRSIIISMMHIKKPPKAPIEINSSLPKELERIVLKSIEKNPDDRYQNAQEMLKEILNFTSNL